MARKPEVGSSSEGDGLLADDGLLHGGDGVVVGLAGFINRTSLLDDEPVAVAEGDPDKDAEFVVQYLKYRNDPAAAKIAVVKSGIRDRSRTLDSMATWMMSRPSIQSAIKAAEASVAAVTHDGDITLGILTAQTEEIRQAAMEDRQYPAALNAVKLTAQMHGFLEQTINVNHSMKVEEMDTEALQRIAARGQVTVDAEYTEVEKGE